MASWGTVCSVVFSTVLPAVPVVLEWEPRVIQRRPMVSGARQTPLPIHFAFGGPEHSNDKTSHSKEWSASPWLLGAVLGCLAQQSCPTHHTPLQPVAHLEREGWPPWPPL